MVEERLDVARRLFNKFDVDGSGFITEEEVFIIAKWKVGPLLIDTYKSMGVNYRPTNDDIKSWMNMTDLDGDG